MEDGEEDAGDVLLTAAVDRGLTFDRVLERMEDGEEDAGDVLLSVAAVALFCGLHP